MKGHRKIGCLLLWILPTGILFSQESGGGPGPRTSLLRWSGSADWEYFENTGESQGTETTFNSLRQKYSLDLSGFLWDPRINRFSLGLDLYRSDRDNAGVRLDSDELGYRAGATFFPNSTIPIRLFARRSVMDVTGTALATNDRETAAWGIDWNVAMRESQKLRLLFHKSSFDLLSPLNLQERRKTGLLDFSRRFRRSDLSFRYDLYDQEERINLTDISRRAFSLRNRTRFQNGATLSLNTNFKNSESRYSTGEKDELNTRRLAIRAELPDWKRIHLDFSYDFNDTEGKFLDSTSQLARSGARFRLSQRWDSTGALTLGRIESASPTSDLEETLTGIQTGLRYHREWNRLNLAAAYSVGYDQAEINTGPDRENLSQYAEVSLHVPLNGSERLFASLSQNRDDNDTTGVGFTRDETRATLGWEGNFGSRGRGRATATFRDLTYDTFQFGLQESEEIALQGSLAYRDGGISLSISTSEGISDFLPTPGSGSPFLLGTDLVSERDAATLGVHWKFLRNLRFRFQAHLENNHFTTIGKEELISYHPEIDYNFRTWKLSAGYSHYERRNSIEFTDDTLLLRVSKRFF